jgi:alpha-glucosidase (family GH31 glycosyl hydrolase)
MRKLAVVLHFALVTVLPMSCYSEARPQVLENGGTRAEIVLEHFRFGFFRGAKPIASPHAESGILVGGASLSHVVADSCAQASCSFSATAADGTPVLMRAKLLPDEFALTVTLSRAASVVIRTRGLSPVYGLADAVKQTKPYATDITGFTDEHLLAGKAANRLDSNFAIFPKQGLAEVLPWPKAKIVSFTGEENAEGVVLADAPVTMHYFFGSPHGLYAAFERVRRTEGYPTFMPKYEMFGAGWEAFGALAWETNQRTVSESVERYRSLGYPIQWVVIGSGFWPAKPEDMHETTSFGLWDRERYPEPAKLIQQFHDEKLRVLLGLRITFITTGPFAEEGARNHYFLEENGKPIVFKPSWPRQPCYLLDAQSPRAVDWYFGLVAKWKALGVDGFKEDFFGYQNHELRDDKLNPISDRLMALGYDLIERNGYLSSDGDLQRIEDFNFNQDQDRGPVNTLAFAYSGLPLGYPDIVGGTFGENHFDLHETPTMDTYMMRNAQWAALHPSLSVGQPPWSFKNEQVGKVMLKAAQTHERLHPYIYSQAVRFVHDGFPWTMTPLPIAYPNEPGVYGRENSWIRGYEWMIGDALLATPLYGNDYATAEARDIYLPKGDWIDYETGERYTGPVLLSHHPIPAEKTPLFVGGTGVVVELEQGKLQVRIYPITKETSTEFWSSDGRTRSSIELAVRDWKHLTVTDLNTGTQVATTEARFAMQFELLPGHCYRVE